MTSPPPVTPHKLLAAWPLKLRLAGGCLALLVAGAWSAPRDTTALAVSQERAAPLLEAQMQEREAAPSFRGLEDVVSRLPHRGLSLQVPAAPGVIADDFDEAALPQTFGVAVDATRLLTHAAALGGARLVMVPLPDGRTVSASVTAYDPTSGLVLVQLPEASAAAATLASVAPAVGALVVAAVTDRGTDRVIPAFITSVTPLRYELSASGGLAPGMPLYSLDGELIAVADGGGAAWPVQAALDRLPRAARRASFGLVYQAIGESLRAAFGDAGVIVVSVVPGGPADVAGLGEGDVITAVGGIALTADHPATEAALTAQPAGTPVTITVRRGRRSVSLTATPIDAYEMAAMARIAARATASGLPARTIFDDAALAAAAIPPSATVVRINGQAVTTPAQATRAIGRTGADAVLLLDYRGVRSFAVVEAAR